ncbi:hypothetical protein QZH41_004576 [Actinostola sp. cb2023]|nr:hypothetical protein QZH41_004576 [Actinostola sp. cb2023]
MGGDLWVGSGVNFGQGGGVTFERRGSKYPSIAQIDHFWVSRTWMRDLGLSQYGPVFEAQMIDGRMLNTLSKKDMEKHLNINKKFHQALLERRSKCEETYTDPIVWTNDKITRWCRSIDLGEYAETLRDTGVHGAIMVLEPTFGSEEMAQSLGIHSSKNIIRRHLTSELTTLILTASHYIQPSVCQYSHYTQSVSQYGRYTLSYSHCTQPSVCQYSHYTQSVSMVAILCLKLNFLLVETRRINYNTDEVWITYGTGKNVHNIPAHTIATSLGPDKASTLPMFHALTGCDTVSFFARRGKKTAWDVWKVFPEADTSAPSPQSSAGRDH